MRSTKDLPKHVRPFVFHGSIDLEENSNGDQWIGTCPLCGKEGKLHVNPKGGLWDCKSCGCEGNPIGFLEQLVTAKHETTALRMWKKLGESRGIPVDYLQRAGLAFDDELGRWLIPALGDDGRPMNVRAWTGEAMFNTPMPAALFGRHLLGSNRKAPVWLCEGEWDAIAMMWLLAIAGVVGVVLAVPGASTFKVEWGTLFTGRSVNIAFDADKAGRKGALKAVKLLKGHARRIRVVEWPEDAPDGWDLRDFITSEHAAEAGEGWAAGVLEGLQGMLRSVVELEGGNTNNGEVPTSPAPLTSEELGPAPKFEQIVDELKRHIVMNPDMVDAFRVLLATATSSRLEDSPIWLYLVGAPSSGKTMLLKQLAASERCEFVSSVKPAALVSGWQGQGDSSLMPRLSARCLVVKDWTEILSLPKAIRDEVYSIFRGAYDGQVERPFGNGVGVRVYNKWSDPPFTVFTILAGVTHAILGHHEANLGDRFLKYVLRPPTADHSRETSRAAMLSIGRTRERDDAVQGMVAAFLERRLDPDNLPEFPIELHDRLHALALLVGTLRTIVAREWRFDNVVQYRPMVEAPNRLVMQLAQLGMALANVAERDKVNEDDMRLVARVARDTAYGYQSDVLEAMIGKGGRATRAEIVDLVRASRATVDRRIEDLSEMGVITKIGMVSHSSGAGRNSTLFAVDSSVMGLWAEAHGENWEPPPIEPGGPVELNEGPPRTRIVRRRIRRDRV